MLVGQSKISSGDGGLLVTEPWATENVFGGLEVMGS